MYIKIYMANYYAYDSDSNVSTATTASNSTNYSDINYDDFSYDVLNVSIRNFNSYRLLIPELYNKYIHGKTMDSDPNVNGQFMVLQSFNYNNSNENKIVELFNYTNSISKFYKKYYLRNFRGLKHDLIKNYKNIITNKSFLNVEIGQVYYLKGDECVCVIKTFWLKLIQRAWKKIYQQRKIIHQKRCNPTSLLYRQITAKWPDDCKYMPSIRGMLL
jgi:hypothetical protein